MHLDGYCDKLKIGIEYNGLQHYDENNYFFTKERVENDGLKKRLCDERGVILIVVPYYVKFDDMQRFIIDEYKKITGISIPEKEVDWRSFIKYKDDQMKEIVDMANKDGTKIISKYYLGHNKKLEFECQFRHRYQMTPAVFKRGCRCQICGREKARQTRKATMAKISSLKSSVDDYDARKSISYE
jgi:hypothetical protein